MRPHVSLLLLLNLAAAAPLHSAILPRLHPDSPWYQRVDQAAVHPDSAGPTGMIATLGGLGGFGNGRMQIDFSMYVLYADGAAPTQPLIEIPGANPDDDYYLPDCDALGTPIPLPAGGAIEGQPGYSCDLFNNDCHLLVVTGNEIFEVYRANVTASGVESQCLARWRMDALYPPQGRGEHCTSADAAGFPIAPLLFNADEVAVAMQAAGGDLGHAIRFILPNNRMASDASLGGVLGRLYVRPASHAGGPSGPSASVPYGARLRLRSDFPMAGYNAAAQVILRTMQRYGIVLADGGTVALTAESDRYTTNTWASLGIGSRVFDQTPGAQDVLISDFAVLDTGPRIAETYECERSQPALDPLFANGFE
jgi:serine/threonine-protein kinase